MFKLFKKILKELFMDSSSDEELKQQYKQKIYEQDREITKRLQNAEVTRAEPGMENPQPMHEDFSAVQQVPQEPERPNFEARISLEVLRDGNTSIDINWDFNSDKSAKALGELLYELNTGVYRDDMMKMITGMATQDRRLIPFMKEAIAHYEKERGEDVVVKPSEVFNYNNPVHQGHVSE